MSDEVYRSVVKVGDSKLGIDAEEFRSFLDSIEMVIHDEDDDDLTPLLKDKVECGVRFGALRRGLGVSKGMCVKILTNVCSFIDDVVVNGVNLLVKSVDVTINSDLNVKNIVNSLTSVKYDQDIVEYSDIGVCAD